jgi:hypothetical protein
MAEHPPCDHGVTGCEGSLEDPIAGSPYCGKCCQGLALTFAKPPPLWVGKAFCMLLCKRDHNLKVLLDSGEPVTDWATVEMEWLSVQGEYYSGKYCPSDEQLSPNTPALHPYPRENEAPEGVRTYANATHVWTLGAIVGYVKKHKKKPRGEELKPYLNAAWTMYRAAIEQARAPRLIECSRAACGPDLCLHPRAGR